ncbi:MAG: type II toxin-antitoxin system Phd/YefM family antitoxin [Cellulomonadaceae bacterium]|nr:type II toxin-antitoxin system Phd/YefM family antitoxin [Cellulomonadaceae bacterium]
MSLAEVEAHLTAIVGSVHDTHERVVITRNGEPAAVLIAPDDLAALEETIDVLSNPALMVSMGEGRADIEADTAVDLIEFRRQPSGEPDPSAARFEVEPGGSLTAPVDAHTK